MLHCSGLWLVTPMKFSWILHTVLGTFPIFFYPVLKCPFLVPTVIPTPNYFLATLCPGVRGPKGLLQLPSLQHGVSLMSLQCDTKNWAVTRAPTASQNQWSCGNVCPDWWKQAWSPLLQSVWTDADSSLDSTQPCHLPGKCALPCTTLPNNFSWFSSSLCHIEGHANLSIVLS